MRLRDVARVAESAEPKFGDALIMGEPGVLVTMASQYGANTLEVTRAVESAIEELKPVFAAQGITVFTKLHRPATFIETALRNVRDSLVLGAALVGGGVVSFPPRSEDGIHILRLNSALAARRGGWCSTGKVCRSIR